MMVVIIWRDRPVESRTRRMREDTALISLQPLSGDSFVAGDIPREVGFGSFGHHGTSVPLAASFGFQSAFSVAENVVKLECLLSGSGVSSTERLLL